MKVSSQELLNDQIKVKSYHWEFWFLALEKGQKTDSFILDMNWNIFCDQRVF